MRIYHNFRPIRHGILFHEELRRVHILTATFNGNRHRLWELERS